LSSFISVKLQHSSELFNMTQHCHLVVRLGEDSHFMKSFMNKILNYNY